MRTIRSRFAAFIAVAVLLPLLAIAFAANPAEAGPCRITVSYASGPNRVFTSISAVNNQIANASQAVTTVGFDNGATCTTSAPLTLSDNGTVVYVNGQGTATVRLNVGKNVTWNTNSNGLNTAETYTGPAGEARAWRAAINITGTNVKVYNLRVRAINHPRLLNVNGWCEVAIGGNQGIHVAPDADNAVIGEVDVQGFYAGIRIFGDNAKVHTSDIKNNDMMALHGGDAGAMGILISGSNNQIGGNAAGDTNEFANNRACSDDYAFDGSSVEIFATNSLPATNNLIQGNNALGDQHFTELGTDLPSSTLAAVGNQYIDNNYDSSWYGSAFLVTRGTGGTSGFGSIGDTTLDGNTIKVGTQPESQNGVDYGGFVIACDGYCFGTNLPIHLSVTQGVQIDEPCTLLDAQQISFYQQNGYIERYYLDSWWQVDANNRNTIC